MIKYPSELIPETPIDNFYKDVAASAQQHFESLMIQIVHYYIDQTSIQNICFAGGAALNCVMNQKSVS